jgi:iron complex outermembrane receptor protein
MVVLSLLLSGLLAAPLAAQPQGRISGVVRDTTGIAVPGVTITATSAATNIPQTTVTGADGTFSLALPPGSYTVTATLGGFRRVSQTVDVAAQGARELNFSIEPALSEEVTVTANKREEVLLDVPFSIAAPTEETLRARGVENLEGVAANVGGFTAQNLGPGQSQIAIRGVSAGQIVRDQPGVKEQVGVYLDESVISLSLFTPDLDLFDTNRVEVLRGPQGTLFGSGSESGTVRYITNQPELHLTKAFAEIGGSGTSGGSAGGNVKFGFNVPLGDSAALRVASYFDRVPGYIDAVQPNLLFKNNVNDGNRTGVRGAATLRASDRLTITPRLMYQRSTTDGWNRQDAYNILGNPYTTTRPAVTLAEREQFTQLEEEFSDNFTLADVNANYNFGKTSLTSITSYTYRDILVVRDATALTASITGGSIGLPQNVYTLNAPLNDATTAKVFTEEARLSGGGARFPWVGGLFYSHTNRKYGQSLPVTGFTALSGIPSKGLRAPTDTLFYSDLGYGLDQIALFGEGTYAITDRWRVQGGLRFYHFSEDKSQIFDGIFGNDNNGTSLVSQPGSTTASGVAPRLIATYKVAEGTNLNAQVSKGFRLGGINDPLNVPLCTSQDLITFGGHDTWKDETVWNYEGGIKSRILGGRGAIAGSLFYMNINDLQTTVTAGSCSSRVIFNVPNARSTGFELEFDAAPNRHIDFALSTSVADGELRSTLTSTAPDGSVSVVSGIQEGRRLPTVPQFQLAAALTYQWDLRRGAIGYATGTYQHIGSRYTQVGDQDLGTLNLLSFGATTIGAPLTATTFHYDPLLPAYDLLNLRVGVRVRVWDVAAYLNNVTNENALLAFDQERGTRARISYLTNQPRTFGISARIDF